MEEKKYFVYMHINKINDKKYIGITCQNPPESRWGSNGGHYKTCTRFYQAIQKYGWDNFEHKILATNLSKEEACQKEINLITKFQTQNDKFGYNIFAGGNAPKLSKETRKKISKSLMGNKNATGNKGKSRPPWSKETRQKIMQSRKDRKPIICIETENEYESIRECARQLNLDASHICKVLKGKLKSTGGYHFKYKNNEDNNI